MASEYVAFDEIVFFNFDIVACKDVAEMLARCAFFKSDIVVRNDCASAVAVVFLEGNIIFGDQDGGEVEEGGAPTVASSPISNSSATMTVTWLPPSPACPLLFIT